MRILIKQHHSDFLKTIANQMGTTTSNALDYILWELRKTNYSFSTGLNQSSSVQKSENQPILHFGNALPTEQPEVNDVTLNQQFEPIDPVIQRFLDLGVDDF